MSDGEIKCMTDTQIDRTASYEESDMETSVIGSSRDQRLNLGCRDSTYVLQACRAGILRQERPEGST